jgi:hypothetical protein
LTGSFLTLKLSGVKIEGDTTLKKLGETKRKSPEKFAFLSKY